MWGEQWMLEPHRQTQERKGRCSGKPVQAEGITSWVLLTGDGGTDRSDGPEPLPSAFPLLCLRQLQQPFSSRPERSWTVPPRAKQKSSQGQVTEAGPSYSFTFYEAPNTQRTQVLNWTNNHILSWRFCVLLLSFNLSGTLLELMLSSFTGIVVKGERTEG